MTPSRFPCPNMCHRQGFKVNRSVGDQSHYCDDERHSSSVLSGRVCTFYLQTSLKGDSLGLAWKTTSRVGVKGVGSTGTLQCICAGVHVGFSVYTHTTAHAYKILCACVVCLFTRFLPVLWRNCLACSGLAHASPYWSKMKDICSSDESG